MRLKNQKWKKRKKPFTKIFSNDVYKLLGEESRITENGEKINTIKKSILEELTKDKRLRRKNQKLPL